MTLSINPQRSMRAAVWHGRNDIRVEDVPLPVDDRYGLASVIDKQLFARTVLLAHDHVDLGRLEAVVFAEPAVLEALRMGE